MTINFIIHSFYTNRFISLIKFLRFISLFYLVKQKLIGMAITNKMARDNPLRYAAKMAITKTLQAT